MYFNLYLYNIYVRVGWDVKLYPRQGQPPLAEEEEKAREGRLQGNLKISQVITILIKPRKCFIGFKSLECLGHIAGDEKLQPVPEKVTAIQRFAQLTTKKEVRSFLGLVGFYKKFIPNFQPLQRR